MSWGTIFDILLVAGAAVAQGATGYLGWRVTTQRLSKDAIRRYEGLFLSFAVVGIVCTVIAAIRAGNIGADVAALRKGQQEQSGEIKKIEEKIVPTPPLLRVVNWERFPRPLRVGQDAGIHLHIKNSSQHAIDATASCAYEWANGNGGPISQVGYDERKAFEDKFWTAAISTARDTHVISIPGQMDDYWIPLCMLRSLTKLQIEGLHRGVTAVYYGGRILDTKGVVLLEYCARLGSDDATVDMCVAHNGP